MKTVSIKFLTPYILILTLALISSCSSLSVTFDYNKSVDFSKFRSFQWRDGIDISWNKEGSTLVYDENIVHSAANAILSSKGYIILLSGTPDFYIYPHANAKDIIAVSEWDYRYSSEWAPNTKIIDADYYEGNNLFIDIVDAKRKVLVWRGVATEMDPDNLTPGEIEKTVQKAVIKMFEDFPPDKN